MCCASKINYVAVLRDLDVISFLCIHIIFLLFYIFYSIQKLKQRFCITANLNVFFRILVF